MIVKPAELQPNDLVLRVGKQTFKQPNRVVRVDKVDPGFVRTVEHGRGYLKGRMVESDWYEMYHPDAEIEVVR